MTYANRTDANQGEIIQALRQVGASVQPLTRVKDGCPDILVGFHGCNYLMEIKTDEGRVTPDELTWFQRWNGQAEIVKNISEALRVIGVYE